MPIHSSTALGSKWLLAGIVHGSFGRWVYYGIEGLGYRIRAIGMG